MNTLPPAFFGEFYVALKQLGWLEKISYNDYWYQQSFKRLYRWNVNVLLEISLFNTTNPLWSRIYLKPVWHSPEYASKSYLFEKKLSSYKIGIFNLIMECLQHNHQL